MVAFREYIYQPDGLLSFVRPDPYSLLIDNTDISSESFAYAEDVARLEGRSYLYAIVYGPISATLKQAGLRLYSSTPVFDLYRKVI